MNSALPQNPGSLEFIDRLIERWGKILIPFFAKDPKSEFGMQSFGSGFIAKYRSQYFLVTALHVVLRAIKEDACAVVIGDEVVSLQFVSFAKDTANDLAALELGQMSFSGSKSTFAAVDLDSDTAQWHSTELHMLCGYPSSKNRLNPRLGKKDLRILSITAERTEHYRNDQIKVADPIWFKYERKKQINSAGDKADPPPDLWGMSGGAALKIVAKHLSSEEIRYSVTLAGVLLEWHKNDHIIASANVKSLKILLDMRISRMAELIAIAEKLTMPQEK